MTPRRSADPSQRGVWCVYGSARGRLLRRAFGFLGFGLGLEAGFSFLVFLQGVLGFLVHSFRLHAFRVLTLSAGSIPRWSDRWQGEAALACRVVRPYHAVAGCINGHSFERMSGGLSS